MTSNRATEREAKAKKLGWASPENRRSLVFSVLLHLVMVAVLLVSWDFSESVKRVDQPSSIKARVLSSAELDALREKNEKQQQQKDKALQDAKKRAEQEAKKKQRLKDEKRRKELAKKKAAEVMKKLRETGPSNKKPAGKSSADTFMEKIREIAPTKKKRVGKSNQKKHRLKRQVLNAHNLSESESD